VQHHNASASDVISVFCFAKNASWCTKQTHFAMTSLFCFAKNARGVYNAMGSSVELDALEKKMGETTFHIIGLAKIPKIEFLPLDWIYRSNDGRLESVTSM